MNFIDYGVPISEINQENEESDEKQVCVGILKLLKVLIVKLRWTKEGRPARLLKNDHELEM